MVERIKELCKQNGTTVKALEEELRLGKSTVRRWDDNSPSVDKVVLVAKHFGVSVDYLIFGGERQPPEGGGLSDLAIAIAKLADRLPPEARKLLLAQVQATEQAFPDPAVSEGSPE